MKVTTPTAFKSELLARPFAKLDVGVVFVDAGRNKMMLVLSETERIGEMDEYFDLERGDIKNGREVIFIRDLPELNNVLIMQIAYEVWPKAHLVWSACSCCCSHQDFRQGWPNKVPARQTWLPSDFT